MRLSESILDLKITKHYDVNLVHTLWKNHICQSLEKNYEQR